MSSVRLARSAYSGSLAARLPITPFILSDPGEGINQCEILKWHVGVDSPLSEFDLICELQHDKANVEITSPFEGVVRKLYYKVGDTAIVGKPLIDIEIPDSSSSTTTTTTSSSTTSSSTSSSSTPTHSASSAFSNDAADAYEIVSPSTGLKRTILATPAVRRIAREHSVDLKRVKGTGPDGRILKEDVNQFLFQLQSNLSSSSTIPTSSSSTTTPLVSTSSSSSSSSSSSASSSPAALSEDRVVPIRGIQKAMFQSMTAAASVPHFGYKDEIQMDALVAARDALRPAALAHGVKLSFMPFFIKAASLALLEHPSLNAHVASADAVVVRAQHNIGVAMDTPQGLLVPSIKDVQRKSLLDVALELRDLQALGAQGRLSAAHLRDATFTLSNIGNIGGTYLFPVLMLPQVAIGAIGRIQRLPRFAAPDSLEVVPAHLLNVSWAADHRVVDGATMARFSNLWKNYLENPSNFLLYLK